LSAALGTFADTGFWSSTTPNQYFERRLPVGIGGHLRLSDATPPSAGRIAELQATVADMEGYLPSLQNPQSNRDVIAVSVFAGPQNVGMLTLWACRGETPRPGARFTSLRNMASEFTFLSLGK